MNSNDEKKQKICYLFLSLDEPITDSDLLKFNQMGASFDGFSESKDSIVTECNQIIDKSIDDSDRYEVVSEGINKIAELMYMNPDKKAEKKLLLWMLESLAWYDGKYTASEKKLIRQLMRKWEIDPSVLIEMEDTAETLISLNNYQNWIKTTNESYGFINSIVQELDKNQKDITDNISHIINLD